jgi:hypothetical protein
MIKQANDPDAMARRILNKMLEYDTLSEVARRLSVNKGLIPYVLRGGHSPTMLNALSLPVLEREVVEACAECGKIHSMHRTCGKKKRHRVRHRKIAELESQEQLEALSQFAGFQGYASWSALCRHLAQWWIDGWEKIDAQKEA